jgi:hypothetical protein
MSSRKAESGRETKPPASEAAEENDEEVDLYSGIELQRSALVARRSDAQRQPANKAPPGDTKPTGSTEDISLSVRKEAARTSGPVMPSGSSSVSEDDEEAEVGEGESSDDEVDIILGNAQPALGEQAAQFAASWNEVTRDTTSSAERVGQASGLGTMNVEASLQSAAVLSSMLPEPTLKNIPPGRQKSLYEVELEQLDEKPWREPGAVLSDYFNYGFTEDTWKIYCQHQAMMRQETAFLQKQAAGNVPSAARERDKGTRGAPAGPGGTAGNLRERPKRSGEEEKAKHDSKEVSKGAEKRSGALWKMAGSTNTMLPSKDVLERLAQVRHQIMNKNAPPTSAKSNTAAAANGREATTTREARTGTARSVSDRQPPASERDRKRKRNRDESGTDTGR